MNTSVLPPKRQQLEAEEIISATCQHYGITRERLMGTERLHWLSFARHIGMAICRETTAMSYHDISQTFNRKHYTTVIHAVKKIKGLIAAKNPDTTYTINAILHIIKTNKKQNHGTAIN